MDLHLYAEEMNGNSIAEAFEYFTEKFVYDKSKLSVEWSCNKVKPEQNDSFRVRFPRERGFKYITVSSVNQAKELYDLPLDDFVFLKDYNAICSYESNYIEATIEPLARITNLIMLRKIFGHEGNGLHDDKRNITPITTKYETEGGVFEIELSSVSEIGVLLTEEYNHPVSLKIKGFNISTHNGAVKILENISNAIFLQIELLRNFPLSLSRDKELTGGYSPKVEEPIDLIFPTSIYDSEPMSLYWYAKNARKNPLIEFLAYYQCIEYYYPIYSNIELKRRIQNVLKNPSFDYHNDTDISRIMNIIERSNTVDSSEKNQLISVLEHTIEPSQLKEFIMLNKGLNEYYSKKENRDSLKVSEFKINSNQKGSDYLVSIANRIYDIRCNIVHRKVGTEEEGESRLMPFSSNTKLLKYDIELVKFISQHVLISNGKALKP